MTGQQAGSPSRRGRIPRLAAVAVLGFAALPVLGPGAASGQVDDAPLDVEVSLASQTAWVAPNGELVLRLSLEGDDVPAPAPAPQPGDEPPPPAAIGDADVELVVTVHERLTSRSAFVLTIDEELLGASIDTTRAPISSLGRDATGAVVVRLGLAEPGALPPAGEDADRIVLGREGVYPVEVEVRSDGETVDGFVTHLVRLPSGDIEPLKVSLVVPIHAPPSIRPDSDATLNPAHRRRLRGLVTALESSGRADVVLAPTPETVDALVRSEDPGDAEILDALREQTATAITLGGPYVPVDPLELVATGLADEIDTQLDTGAAVLEEALRSPVIAGTWLARTPLDAITVTALRDAGVRRLVIDESALEPLSRTLTLAQPFLVEGALDRRTVALATDPGLSSHLRAAADPVLAAHRFLADLAVLYFDEPAASRAVVAWAPEEWSPPPALVETVLAGLSTGPIVDPVGVEEAADVPLARSADGDALVRVPLAADPPSATALDDIPEVRRMLGSVATMVPEDVEPLVAARRQLLTAQSIDLTGGQQIALVDGAFDRLDEVLAQVEVPTRRTVTLTARTGEIPVTLRNDAAWPAEVVVSLDADQLRFPQGASRTIQLPGGNTTAGFQVEARTSGAFPLRVRVTTPDGLLVLGETRYTIRSTVVSGVGLALTGASVAFLVAWWGLHLRRNRADKTGDR